VLAGARIDRVTAGAPADGVLQKGDVVLKLDNKQIRSELDFIRMTSMCTTDRDVPLLIQRDTKEFECSIRPRRRTLPIEPVTQSTQSFCWAGVRFENHEHGVVVVEVMRGAITPLAKGSVLAAINDRPICELADLLEALHNGAGGSLKIDLLSEH
jgi:PDZ domain-containing secreted protein